MGSSDPSPGLRGTAERLPQPFVLLADPGRHGHHAADIGAQLFCPWLHRAADNLTGLVLAKSRVRRGCSSPCKGVSTLEWTVPTPVPCTEHTAGRVPSSPGGGRGGPPWSSAAQCPLPAVNVTSPLQPPPVSRQSLARGNSGPALSPELSLHQSCGRHLTPLLRHHSGGSWCCSSPASQSLVLSSPGLTGAENPWDLPVLHREPSPEALYSWLPRGLYPHSHIADPPGRLLPKSPAFMERGHRAVFRGRAQKGADAARGVVSAYLPGHRDCTCPARTPAVLLLLVRVPARRAHRQFLSSQMLLTFTNCQSAVVCERAVGRIGRLSDLLASCSSVEVRSQAPSSQALSPSLHTGAACSSEMPARQAWALAEAFSKALPWSEGLGFLLFSFSHGLLSPVPSLPGAVSAPSPAQDGTAQGTWWEPRPGSSPCPAAQLAALRGPSKAPAHRGSFPWAESWVQGFGHSCCPSALLPVLPPPPRSGAPL